MTELVVPIWDPDPVTLQVWIYSPGFLLQIRELRLFLLPKRQAVYETGAADMNDFVKTTSPTALLHH